MKKQKIRITWEGVITLECQTVIEAARTLGCTTQTIYNALNKDGQISHLKIYVSRI